MLAIRKVLRADLRRKVVLCYRSCLSILVEIEHAVRALPAAGQEALFRLLAARFEAGPLSVAPYRTKTQPGAVRPGINPDKLGQLPDEF